MATGPSRSAHQSTPRDATRIVHAACCKYCLLTHVADFPCHIVGQFDGESSGQATCVIVPGCEMIVSTTDRAVSRTETTRSRDEPTIAAGRRDSTAR
jgi:hypothetical protein